MTLKTYVSIRGAAVTPRTSQARPTILSSLATAFGVGGHLQGWGRSWRRSDNGCRLLPRNLAASEPRLATCIAVGGARATVVSNQDTYLMERSIEGYHLPVSVLTAAVSKARAETGVSVNTTTPSIIRDGSLNRECKAQHGGRLEEETHDYCRLNEWNDLKRSKMSVKE